MKKIYTMFYIILICCTFMGCNVNPSTNPTKNNSSKKHLTQSKYEVNAYDQATISDISISDEIITLTFTYSGENQLNLGAWFIVEIYEDGMWYTLPYDIENCFDLEAYPVEPNQSKTMEYHLESVYKSLPAGKYRIITEVSDFVETGNYTDYYLAAEFEIK